MYILKKGDLKNPISLSEYFDDVPAISHHDIRIDRTLPGQWEISMADSEYKESNPRLVNKKTIIPFMGSSEYVRL